MAAEVDGRTSAVLVSAVLFETARIVPRLGELADACAAAGAELLVDVYHALGALPFRVAEERLESAWIVGGGYKYLQLGEGNCFLRLPPQAEDMRPVLTGWFAEFELLAAERGDSSGGVSVRRCTFRRLDLRPDEPLPGGTRLRVLRGARPHPRAPARVLPPPDRAARRPLRPPRRPGGADDARPLGAARRLRRVPRRRVPGGGRGGATPGRRRRPDRRSRPLVPPRPGAVSRRRPARRRRWTGSRARSRRSVSDRGILAPP